MTSIEFTQFFTELSLLAKVNSEIKLEKTTRKQLYESVVIEITAYKITYPSSNKNISLTIGELQIETGFLFFLYLNEYQLEPDAEAAPEQYDAALNTFQETYNEQLDALISEVLIDKNNFELNHPEIKI